MLSLFQQGEGMFEDTVGEIVFANANDLEDVVPLLGGGVLQLEQGVQFVLVGQHRAYIVVVIYQSNDGTIIYLHWRLNMR